MNRLPYPHPEYSPPAWEPPPPQRPRRPRFGPRTHLILAILTFITLALAGGFFWAGDPADGGHGWLGDRLVSGLPYAFWAFMILGAHEMGHYLACRYYRIPASLPFFIPSIPPLGTFGAVIRIRGPIPHRRALFDVAAAGPIAGFVIAVPVLLVGMMRADPAPVIPPEAADGAVSLGVPMLVALFGDRFASLQANTLIGAGWVGMLVTSLNLFPVGQLDGGHAVYALSRQLHRWMARLSLAGLLALIIVQMRLFRQVPAYLLWFGILLWMRDRHPRLLDESVPLGPGRKLVALLLLIIFCLSLIPVPIVIGG